MRSHLNPPRSRSPDTDVDGWTLIQSTPKSCSRVDRPLPLPPPRDLPSRPKYRGHPLQLGGLPLPPPRTQPKSLQPKPPVSMEFHSDQSLHFASDASFHRTAVSIPSAPCRAQAVSQSRGSTGITVSSSSALLRMRFPSQSNWLVQEWKDILRKLGRASSVYQSLAQSDHADQHATRVLDQFAPSTLLRYFAAWKNFHGVLHSLQLDCSTLTEAQLADAIVVVSLGKRTDCSAGSQLTIKAMRWIATHAGVTGLAAAWSPLVESFLKSRIPAELKESMPLTLFTVLQFERRLLMSSCPMTEVVILGSILLCVWSSLRFADAQRCSFGSMCFDGISLRGSCWRTKTSSRGQPWGVLASGFLSLGSFNWIEKWLVSMDELWFKAKSTHLDMPTPDFLFPQLSQDGIALPWTPMSYAEALAWIRKMACLPWKSQPQPSSQWTAHSMKSTLLAWGAQMVAEGRVTAEERMLQGHHRQGTSKSLRTYSRDDVHGQLAFQRKVVEFVRRGGRFSTPLHRGAQHPIIEPQVQVEFFRKDSLQREWKCFQFSASTAQVVDSPHDAPEDIASSEESSSSSSSDEASSTDEVTAESGSKKQTRPIAEIPVADEVLLAFMTTIQHAMVGSKADWHPYFEGRHFQAACGARLDPDRTRFTRTVDGSLKLCQRPACMKAWKATLL